MEKLKERVAFMALVAMTLIASQAAAFAAGASLAVKDDLGREVTIPENPQRVLALTSAAMQAVVNSGAMPVGKVEDYRISEKGMALPSVGRADSINIEAVYALKPDLIVASSRFHAALKEELIRTGAVVFFFDPDAVGEIPLVELTGYVGHLIGRDKEANAYMDMVFDRAAALKKKVANGAGVKTGVVLQAGSGVKAAQSASSFGSMLTLLGIENVVPANLPNAKKASFVSFDVEAVLAADPDLVFIVTNSKDRKENQRILRQFKADVKWQTLGAVKNGRVLILPFAVNPNRSAAEVMLEKTAEAILENAK
ncbi:MAG: ABC transporter substrate-binding protein [Pyramidobacter sp.]|uniref:ABC transporter substrate-binding protein n=2 Tax=Pyramidobacter sp. TaxID=1943581 RepID=UPI0025E13FAD|nr:ABC transporter substrate-binding protein [Pyramidobacter sp.]MCI7404655.1 ABC transporter substrate-binding protein [Pyramidobacter sp.]